MSDTAHMAPFERVTAELPGGEVTYWVAGEGPPVLYFHAAGGARATAGLQLLARHHRIYMPVVPGFDDTPLLEGVKDMRDIARLGAELIDSVIGERCDVVGQSFGGWVAPWVALDHVDKLGLLVLECPAGFRPADHPPPTTDPASRVQQMYAHPERRPPEHKSEATLARNRELLHYYHDPEPRDETLIARLGEIEALTLILMGTKDVNIPPASGQLLMSKIPHAFLMYIYDAAHSIETDQPERFASAVGDFLSRGEAFIVNQSGSNEEAGEARTA